MNKSLSLLLAIAGLGFAVLMPGRPKAVDDETKLLQLEHAWNQAEMGLDSAAIASLFDDTLVYVDYDGTLMNKVEYLRSVANPIAKPDHLHDEGMKVRIFGNAGLINGVYRESGTTKGKPYSRRARFTDTWIKQDGQWKCVASQSTLIE